MTRDVGGHNGEGVRLHGESIAVGIGGTGCLVSGRMNHGLRVFEVNGGRCGSGPLVSRSLNFWNSWGHGSGNALLGRSGPDSDRWLTVDICATVRGGRAVVNISVVDGARGTVLCGECVLEIKLWVRRADGMLIVIVSVSVGENSRVERCMGRCSLSWLCPGCGPCRTVWGWTAWDRHVIHGARSDGGVG